MDLVNLFWYTVIIMKIFDYDSEIVEFAWNG